MTDPKTPNIKTIAPGTLIADPRFLRGLRVEAHGWVETDGSIIVRRGDRFTAYYEFHLVRDTTNDAPKRPTPPEPPQTDDQLKPF